MIEFDTQIIPTARAMFFLFSRRVQLSKCAKNFTLPVAAVEGHAARDAGRGRTFRRRTSEFWEVWPMPVPDGELHRVLFVDGIWLAERLVVLICRNDGRVVSWYMVDWIHLLGQFQEN